MVRGRARSLRGAPAAGILTLLVAGGLPIATPVAADTSPSPLVWRQAGPAPIRIDDPASRSFGEGWGGVVYDVAIDPRGTTDRVIYVATNGGIWKSSDGGDTWSPKTDAMPSNSTGAVALDPDDPEIVYAGTGTLIDPLGINFRADALYRSIDGGATWAVLGRNVFGRPVGCARTRNNTCGRGISRIVVLRGSPKIVLVATNRGLFRRSDADLIWRNVLAPPLANPGDWVTDLDVDTADPSTVYASVAGVGVLRSVDRGATFTRNLFLRPGSPAPGTFGSLAFAQSTAQGMVPNNRLLYVNVAPSSPCPSLFCPPLGIWKSIEFGRTWGQARATGLGDCQKVCGVDQTIGVDPVDPNIVHVGLVEHYVSFDGARFFARDPGVWHVDQVATVFSPPGHDRGGLAASPVWLGNHGGVWHGVPRERICVPIFGCHFTYAWESRNEGLANFGFVSTDIGRGSAASNAFTYAGAWDHGLVSKRPADPGLDWHLGFGPADGGFVTVDPNNPLRAYGSANSVFAATDSAGSDGWGVPLGPIPNVVWRVAVDPSSRGAAAPFTSRWLYALAGATVYRSIDGGGSFAPIFTSSGPNPLALAIAPSDPNVLWLGMGDGTLRATADALSAAPIWSAPIATGAPARPVTAVAIHPTDPTEIAIGYGLDNLGTPTTRAVWFTTNNGADWTDITGDLLQVPVNAVVIDPSTSPPAIIVGSDQGVLYTTDAITSIPATIIAARWSPLGTGLPTAYAMQLAHDGGVVPEILRVGTYGRSAFELFGPVTDLRVALRHDPEPVLGDTFTYRAFVTNAGFEPVSGVVARLELDPALSFVSGGGCAASPSHPQVVICRVAGLDAPEGGVGVQFDVVVHVKACPPDRTVTSRWSAGSLLLSDTAPANNATADTATLVCLFPDTFITSAVDGDGTAVPYFGKTTSAIIKFTFEGSEGTIGFECSLDHDNFAPCTSPATYPDLIPSDHTFEVRALDANGNRDPTPADHVWTVL